jgi:hypothetical protein
MKKNNDFTKLLLSMEDETFFYIIRNYLGPLQTPFHKPTLIKDLIKFLSIKSVQEKILVYIDTLDKKVLTAVFLLIKPKIHDIYQLLQGEYEFFQLQQTIINLEERLLLLTAETNAHLQINPLFSEIIKAHVVDITMLIGSRINPVNLDNIETSCSAEFLLKPIFLPSLLTYYFHNKFAMFPDGKYKKKTEENIIQYLGDKSQSELFLKACYLANHALFSLGLLVKNNSDINLNDTILFENSPDNTKLLQHLTPFNIFVLSLIHILSLPVSKLTIRVITSFLLLLNNVSDFCFSKDDISRMLSAANLLNKTTIKLNINENSLIELLVSHKIFLINQDNKDLSNDSLLLYVNPVMKPLLSANASQNDEHGNSNTELSTEHSQPFENTKVYMTIDSDYSIIIDPEIPIYSYLQLYPFIELRKFDNKYLFELTKNSFLKAIDSGKTLNQFITASSTLAKREVPSHILSSMKSWLDVFNRIDIFFGIVVKSDPFLSRIIETHPDINKYVIEKLSDGIFLMDKENEASWRILLTNAGMDFLPTTKSAVIKVQNSQENVSEIFVDALENDYFSENYIDIFSEKNPLHTIISDDIMNKQLVEEERPTDQDIYSVQSILTEKLKAMKFPEKDYEEFNARIEKKLILVPEQLRGSPLHRTIWEAKGLDYQGKLNLCRNAIKNGNDLIEIHMRKIDGSEIVTLLRPLSLENPGKDAVLKGIIVPEETEAEFIIRKIFLLRKLKSSLFSP